MITKEDYLKDFPLDVYEDENNKYKWEKLDEFNARRKMTEFLLRRGFKWEVIKKSLDEF